MPDDVLCVGTCFLFINGVLDGVVRVLNQQRRREEGGEGSTAGLFLISEDTK